MNTKSTPIIFGDLITVDLLMAAVDKLSLIENYPSELKKNPAKLREIAIKAGISTPTGRLRKQYRMSV